MAGLPKVYAKMGFKKGWAAFRAAKARKGIFTKKMKAPAGFDKTRHHSANLTKPKRATMGAVTVKEVNSLKSRLSGALKKARESGGMKSAGDTALALGEALGAGLVTSYAFGAIPTGNLPRPAAIKGGLQLAAGGAIAILVKNKHAKYAGFGMAFMGGLALLRDLLPVPTFAGEVDAFMYGEDMGDPMMGQGEDFPTYAGDPMMGDPMMGDPMMGTTSPF